MLHLSVSVRRKANARFKVEHMELFMSNRHPRRDLKSPLHFSFSLSVLYLFCADQSPSLPQETLGLKRLIKRPWLHATQLFPHVRMFSHPLKLFCECYKDNQESGLVHYLLTCVIIAIFIFKWDVWHMNWTTCWPATWFQWTSFIKTDKEL